MGDRSVYLPTLIRGGKRFVVKNDNAAKKTKPLSARKLRRERVASHDFVDGACSRCGYELVELAGPSEWVRGCQ